MPSSSIIEKLNAAETAIKRSLADPEIQTLVAAYGYPPDKLNEGYAMYEAAVKAVDDQVSASGAEYIATARLEKARKEAGDAYLGLVKVARIIYAKDKTRLSQLGISGSIPKSPSAFIQTAGSMFETALNTEGIKKALTAYGYGENFLHSEHEKINVYDRAKQAYEALNGNAKDAVKRQNTALKELDNWSEQYRKIAQVALKEKKELLDKLGIKAAAAKKPAPKKKASRKSK